MPEASLYVNGKIYAGWSEAKIMRSLDAVSGKFELSVIDKWEASAEVWGIRPGDVCAVKVGGTPLITGYVDAVAPSYSAAAHAISISGRDKTCDLVDCSALDAEFNGLTLAAIAKRIVKPFGLETVVQIGTSPAFPKFAINPGESCWEALNRAAAQRFEVITTDGLGRVVISDVGYTSAHDALTEGKNIKAASASYDYSNRFSKYIIKAQQQVNGGGDPYGDEASKPAVSATTSDANVTRYRPKIINNDTDANEGSAQERVEYEAARRAADSTSISVTVAGWTQSNGELWPLNSMVFVDSPRLSIKERLLISSVKFILSLAGGYETEMELTRADAYKYGRKHRRAKKVKKGAAGLDGDPFANYIQDKG